LAERYEAKLQIDKASLEAGQLPVRVVASRERRSVGAISRLGAV
jgi:hypothetical protein